MGMAMKLSEYLNANGVPYEVLSHPHSSNSMRTARSSHVPADCLAKAVVLEDQAHCFVAVLPASRRLNIDRLRAASDRTTHLAPEAGLKELFGDCEPGAVPPVGMAYGMETVLDESLTQYPDIYFEAGDHETLVHMKTEDFIGLMKSARHMALSAPVQDERDPLF